MRKKIFWALGALVLLIIVSVSCMTVKHYVGVKQSEEGTTAEAAHTQPERALMPQATLRSPPKGETYTTGHYNGDQWHRTVPPEPETITYNGETLTYDQLLKKAIFGNGNSDDQPEFEKRLLEAFPYSQGALRVRYHHYGGTQEVRISQLKEMLKYHSDAPRVYKDLLDLTQEKYPEEAIEYGKAALKYIDVYPRNSTYMSRVYLEKIHGRLGFAYQRIGDYKTALEHLKKADQIQKANPQRINYYTDGLYASHIRSINKGTPTYGPLKIKRNRQKPEMDVGRLDSPGPGKTSTELTDPPPIQTDNPLYRKGDPPSVPQTQASPRDLAKKEAQAQFMKQAQAQFMKQAQERYKQDRQKFNTFVQELHQMATIKTEGDFEKFLTQKLVKRLQGNPKSNTQTDTGPSISADRMRRASQIFRRAQSPAAGLKELQKVDPDLAKTLQQVR